MDKTGKTRLAQRDPLCIGESAKLARLGRKDLGAVRRHRPAEAIDQIEQAGIALSRAVAADHACLARRRVRPCLPITAAKLDHPSPGIIDWKSLDEGISGTVRVKTR